MPTSLITRTSSGVFVETVKNAPLNNLEVDGNFITLAENKLERENNLSDIISALDARANLGVPDLQGAGAFGTWPISVAGNSGTATSFQNARTINGVSFDGTSNITITATTDNTLFFGNGINGDDFDGSSNVTVSVDGDVVVLRTGNQIINGTKTFNNAVEIETQATSPNHAVVGSREITAGNGLVGGGDLTDDVTLEVDDSVILVKTDVPQTIDGDKTFVKALNLNTPGTAATHAVRADRAINSGDGLSGGGSLGADRTLSVDSTVLRNFGDETIGGTKTFSASPVLLSPGSSTNEAVRADRAINSGDGLSGGGNLTTNLNLSVDSSVVRTFGGQFITGQKQFSEAVVLNTQGSSATEALAAGRQVNTGDGLNGGGNLTTNRTLSVDNTVVRTSREIITGDGINGGGDLGSDRTLSVDGTVVRTSGTQTISGAKTFDSVVEFSDQAIFENPITLTSPTTETTQAVRADRTINTGDGINGGGNLASNLTLEVDDTVVRTTGDFTFTGDYIFTGDVTLSNQALTTSNPVRADRELVAGDGLSGGGILLNDVSFSVDGSVARTSTQINAGTGLNGGGTLAENRTLNVNNNIIDAVNIVETEITSTTLSEIVTLTVGDVLTSDAEEDTGIESAGDSDVTDSDLILDSDFAELNVGEVVIGLQSGARGIIVEIVEESDFASIDVRMISGTFEFDGEVIEGEDSGETVEVESAAVTQTFEAQDIRSSGEVIDFIPSSSENIENVLDINNALDKVLAIGGKTFDWTDDHLINKGAAVEFDEETEEESLSVDGYHLVKSDFGVVAEDVKDIFPQGVREKENGELVVDYRKMFALAFAAIKELNDKII